MPSWSWGGAGVPRWLPDNTIVADVARDFGATPAWVDATDDDGPKIQAALDQACASHMAVFIPRGTFHVHSTVYVPAGCALIGAGKHVATISSTSEPIPSNPATPIISLEAAAGVDASTYMYEGSTSTFISE